MLNIDKVFCINIKTSIERKKQFEENFPELINSPIFEWYHPERDNENPKRGCYNSHRNIWLLAKERNYSNIIIFEDDSKLLVTWQKFVDTINNIEYPDNWKLIQLGYLPFRTNVYNKTLVSISSSICAHSYIENVNNVFIPEFNGLEIDKYFFIPDISYFFLNKNLDGMYGIYPTMLVKQNSDKSTISPYRNNLGTLEYDRDTLLKISTSINLYLFVGIIFIMFVIILIIFIAYKFS